MARNHTLVFIDGSHYDRLRTALETPIDLRKLVDVAVNGRTIDQALFYRDRRDEAEAQRLKKLFDWLERNGFVVKSRRHERDEARERYGSNLIDLAIDALELSQEGDQVFIVAADKKLLPLCFALKGHGVAVTLVSTMEAPATIAPPDVLLDAVDEFVDIADVLDEVAAAPPREKEDLSLARDGRGDDLET